MFNVVGSARPPNKGMKLTKPEHIGALQLIPGVRRIPGLAREVRRPDRRAGSRLRLGSGALLSARRLALQRQRSRSSYRRSSIASREWKFVCSRRPFTGLRGQFSGFQRRFVRPLWARRALKLPALRGVTLGRASRCPCRGGARRHDRRIESRVTLQRRLTQAVHAEASSANYG
jgi:hypothetical protein